MQGINSHPQPQPPPLPPAVIYSQIQSPPPISATVQPQLVSSSKPPQMQSPEAILTPSPHDKLLTLSNIGRLAVKSAREAYFGLETMKMSTVCGYTDYLYYPRTSYTYLNRN